jgi:CheY-like chemotaxis protein
MPDTPEARKAPGILYYDPNPTTAKLATASLRLAGYQVFNATGQRDAVTLFKTHGASGDNSIVALLLDASADPAVSASVLRELVRLPGAADIPGILIVSRRNPNPIPAAAGLPTVRRPFSSPALLKVVSETVASLDAAKLPPDMDDVPDQRKVQLARLISKHFPRLGQLEQSDMAAVESLFQELEGAEELPSPPGEQAIRVDLGAQRLESLLEMLSDDSVTGVLSISSDGREARLHLAGGQIRLAEYFGDDEDLKLGRFVVEGGFMRDDELEAFIVGRDPAGRPLGQRLVEAGFITPGELAAAILAQAREITCHVLTFRKGVAGFVPLAKLENSAASGAGGEDGKVELAVSEALLDGLRRLDENALMGPQMPDLDDVYVRDDARVSRLAREILARDELDVLELINGRNSVKDIARRTRTGTFAVSRIVYRLAKSNVVRRRVMPVTV